MITKSQDFKITLELKKRAVVVTEQLFNLYGYDNAGRVLEPIDELVFTILSQNTTDKNTWVAFKNLKEKYPQWEQVLVAPESEIIDAISYAGLSKQKGPRIKKVVEILNSKCGKVSLDFISDMDVSGALSFLISLPGVGRKTASCVLLFNFNMPCMPVDTHVLRISKILDLIPANVDAGEACDLLEKIVSVEDYLRFHVNIIIHGRNLCTARKRYCDKCPLSNICSFSSVLG